ISGNPNPVPGTTPARTVNVFVTKSVTKAEVKIYTKASRLVRSVSLTLNNQVGQVALTIPGETFAGLSKGMYYFVVIVTGADNSTAKSKIEKLLIQ
ncbi:MAG: hypothetical protein LLG37_00815, partial [Spirochaetia bacterium]|nr:hypothetical protein [Spirochaetia bacterium]